MTVSSTKGKGTLIQENTNIYAGNLNTVHFDQIKSALKLSWLIHGFYVI